ncbi:MAG: hypothetical protein IH949_09710 [Bacteroidetes bacterium]|nr:hypothetical protein [Bacteroidota bacterium]
MAVSFYSSLLFGADSLSATPLGAGKTKMINQLKIINLLAILFSVILYMSCEDDFNEEEDVARLEHMEQEILENINDLSCIDSTDCRYIGFGAKPCGGYWRYLIYSINNVDSVLLIEKVRKYNEYNKTLNMRYGWMSDCSLAPIPVVGCSEGECINIKSN